MAQLRDDELDENCFNLTSPTVETTAFPKPADDSVESGLSACDVWLSMAENLLVNAHQEAVDALFNVRKFHNEKNGYVAQATSLDERLANRIVEAMALLYKVRGEVERLRQAEIRRSAESVSLHLMRAGLRSALQKLLYAQNEPFVSFPTVELLFTDRFAAQDEPTDDEGLLRARREVYHLLKTLLQAAGACYQVFYLSRTDEEYRFASNEQSSLPIRLNVWLDAEDNCLRSVVHVSIEGEASHKDKIIRFLLRMLSAGQFEKNGGRLQVTTRPHDGIQIAATFFVDSGPVAYGAQGHT